MSKSAAILAKLYSVHAPEVECISKGKAHKRYEFGCKVRIVTTNQKSWVVGVDAESGNPYDGATLKPAIAQVERLTGVKVKEAFVDKGYRGSEHHPEGVSVYLSGRKNLSPRLAKMLKTKVSDRASDRAHEARSWDGAQSFTGASRRSHQCDVE